jgi:hypothetical protein
MGPTAGHGGQGMEEKKPDNYARQTIACEIKACTL